MVPTRRDRRSHLHHRPAKGAVADLDGTGYLTPPAGLIAASTTLTISLSFRADPGTTGILLSTGSDTPDKLNINTMPIMYIGTDGRLYAQYWNGYVRPMVSAQPVNDGQWHTATLGADGNNQSLFLDDDLRVGMAGSPDIRNLDPQNFVGSGVFPLSTTKFWVNAPGDTTKTRASYFHGEISDVIYYTGYLNPAQLTPFHQPKPITGPITSEISSDLCIDDSGNGTTNGNKIQIYTCNGSAAQQWTITPDPTNGLNNTVIDHKCMTVSGGGTANNTPIILSDCTGAVSQEWHLDSLGELWNPHSGRCLADPASSTTPGTQLIIYDCDYNKDQNWHVPYLNEQADPRLCRGRPPQQKDTPHDRTIGPHHSRLDPTRWASPRHHRPLQKPISHPIINCRTPAARGA